MFFMRLKRTVLGFDTVKILRDKDDIFFAIGTGRRQPGYRQHLLLTRRGQVRRTVHHHQVLGESKIVASYSHYYTHQFCEYA